MPMRIPTGKCQCVCTAGHCVLRRLNACVSVCKCSVLWLSTGKVYDIVCALPQACLGVVLRQAPKFVTSSLA